MSTPDLVPRRPLGGVVAVWIASALAGIAIGVFVPFAWRTTWMTVALGACLVLAFLVQLWYGRAQGFIQRMAVSVLGSLLVLGVISAAFGLAALMAALPLG